MGENKNKDCPKNKDPCGSHSHMDYPRPLTTSESLISSHMQVSLFPLKQKSQVSEIRMKVSQPIIGSKMLGPQLRQMN